MATRFSLLAAAFTVSITAPLFVPAAWAQNPPAQSQPDVENSRYQFLGVVNAPGVQIRSGPGDNYYATAKLDKGTQLTVVGIKFDWLKIVPPEGSFSVVAKAFIARDGNSPSGKVLAEALNVRAGSSLFPMKVTVQCKLSRGAEVQIIGEQDEYYMIKPPAEAYLYVHQKFVDPLKQLSEQSAVASRGATTRPVLAANTDSGTGPTTRPTENVAQQDRQPQEPKVDHVAEAIAQFQQLEVDAKNADGLPLAERPYPQLIEASSALVKSGHLPAQQQQLAEARLASLNIKNRARAEYVQTVREMEATATRIAQIRDRQPAGQPAAVSLTVFTALGKLQASSVHGANGESLYRITDPSTGRSLCYVRAADGTAGGFIDKFVGVRGELATDAQLTLKVVNAADIAAVDPAQVNHGVTAQIVPPSMVDNSAGTTATTNGN